MILKTNSFSDVKCWSGGTILRDHLENKIGKGIEK